MPRWFRITAIVLAVLVVGISGFAWWMLDSLGQGPEARCAGHTRFLAGVWRDSTKANSALAVRGCLVDDLLATHDFHGRARAQVVALLGEPRPTEYFREYDLVYWLGPERSFFSIDSEWLVFKLDPAGRVRDYRLITD